MNDRNEIKENEVAFATPEAESNPVKKNALVVLCYFIFNLIYFLLFLGSCPYVLMSPMVFDGGDSMGARIAFVLIISFPIIIIGIMWAARYFYRKGQMKAAFLVLLLPPVLYLVYMLVEAYVWSL